MAFKGARGVVSIIDKATKPLRSIAESFRDLGKSSKNTNSDLSKTQKAINGIAKSQNRLNRVQSNIKRQTRDIGGQAVGIAALALSFKSALQPAIRFEQSMKDLEAVAFGSADSTVPIAKNMELLSTQAKKLGASTAFSASQAAEGQIFLAKAGFKTNQILAAMPALLDLAAASGADLGRTSDILSDLLGAFGKKAEYSGKLADILATATSSANVDMETLFETLKVAAPIGIAAGQSVEGLVAATALLGNVGIKGGRSATVIKNALGRLAAPAAEGRKVLSGLGIEVADVSGKILPLDKIMRNFSKSAAKLSQIKRIAAMKALFGEEALAGGVNLVKFAASKDFEKMIKNFNDIDGVANKMAKIRMDSTEGSIVQLMSAVEGLAISFGSILTPSIKFLAGVVTGITAPIGRLINDFPILTKIIGAVAGILLVSKIAVFSYTAAMWMVLPAISAAKFALSAIKTPLIVFNTLLKANPIGLVVGGVMLLATAGIALYDNWDKVVQVFKDLWATIKAIDFESILGFLGKVTSPLGALFEGGKAIFEASSNETPIVQPQQAIQAIQGGQVNNTPVTVAVNISDNKVQGIETKGATTSEVFLNDGKQF